MSQLPEKIRNIKLPLRVVSTNALAQRFGRQHGLKPKDVRVITHPHDLHGWTGPVVLLPAGERNSDVMRELQTRKIFSSIEVIELNEKEAYGIER